MQGSVQTEATSTNAGSFWATMLRPFARGFIKFLCFSYNEIRLLFFLSLALTLSLLSTSVWT